MTLSQELVSAFQSSASDNSFIVVQRVKEHFVVLLLTQSSQIKAQTLGCGSVMNITNYVFTV